MPLSTEWHIRRCGCYWTKSSASELEFVSSRSGTTSPNEALLMQLLHFEVLALGQRIEQLERLRGVN